jgi:hypothetical protein
LWTVIGRPATIARIVSSPADHSVVAAKQAASFARPELSAQAGAMKTCSGHSPEVRGHW